MSTYNENNEMNFYRRLGVFPEYLLTITTLLMMIIGYIVYKHYDIYVETLDKVDLLNLIGWSSGLFFTFIYWLIGLYLKIINTFI